MQHATFSLVEESAGRGQLFKDNTLLHDVRYSIRRYQGMLVGSGLPVPGLHRVEGTTDLEPIDPSLVGAPLTLRLEDGRAMRVTFGCDGQILTEGHGPGRGCSCC